LKPDDFQLLADLLRKRSGLAIGEDKIYLLESRLTPVARKLGMSGLDDLVTDIRRSKKESVLEAVTEAMTTNESFFYRDGKPFEIFRNFALPELIKSRGINKSLKIWSAACSTGQEPYTIAMILKDEAAKMAGWRYDILGTDLSEEVLEKAKVGVYSQFEVQRGLPINQLVAYFKQVNETWQIDAGIRAMVKYRAFNLLNSLLTLGRFDIVFCRNVLIYFDQPTKKDVLERIAKQMPDDGYLFLGAAETVMGITDAFAPVAGQRGIYTRT
jgi:chemotaxis protein methyltransferase CheR